jgi:hypothetical protein
MRNSSRVGVIWLFVLFYACAEKEADPESYRSYLTDEKNGLVQEKEVDGLIFKAQWLTPEMMALNEMKATNDKNTGWDKLMSEYQGLAYLRLSIYGNEVGNVHAALAKDGLDVETIEAYLNFDAERDVSLLCGKDTMRAVLYNFSKTYGLARQLDLATGFDLANTDTTADITLDWNTSVMNCGLLKFRFLRKDIDRIPNLKF